MTTEPAAEMAGRFWRWVQIGEPDECWPWLGHVRRSGYPGFNFGGRAFGAHRLALVISTGENPVGMHACHSCHNRSCCNPAHLHWGTALENVHESLHRHGPHYNSLKTHCPQGHPYAEDNLYRYGTARHCKACVLQRTKERVTNGRAVHA